MSDKIPAYVDRVRLREELSISDRTIDAWVEVGILPPALVPKGIRPSGKDYEAKQLWEWKEVVAWLHGKRRRAVVSPAPTSQTEEIFNASKNYAQRH